MANEIKSMAEHTDLLLYIVGVLLSGGVVQTLRQLARIEKKQDEQRATHEQCRLTLMSKEDFNHWKLTDFKEWKEGRDGPDGLWHALNKHSHVGIDGSGKVVKT